MHIQSQYSAFMPYQRSYQTQLAYPGNLQLQPQLAYPMNDLFSITAENMEAPFQKNMFQEEHYTPNLPLLKKTISEVPDMVNLDAYLPQASLESALSNESSSDDFLGSKNDNESFFGSSQV